MLATLALLAVALVAIEHVYILVLEMFLWTTPRGRRAFDLTPEFAQATRAMAANQGLYNGFLAAGLAWGLIEGDTRVQLFFLGCVVVAGVFGAATASRKIFWLQAAPAIVAMALVLLSR